jgi:hypothetical protein
MATSSEMLRCGYGCASGKKKNTMIILWEQYSEHHLSSKLKDSWNQQEQLGHGGSFVDHLVWVHEKA